VKPPYSHALPPNGPTSLPYDVISPGVLAELGVAIVTLTRLYHPIAFAGLVFCTLFTICARADVTATTQPGSKATRLTVYPHPIGAGVLGLAAGSTDVIIAEVLETNPREAIEGARDNMKLKVVRLLMGRPAVGETLDLYYHLLWTDKHSMTLEAPKFEKGKQYILFLRSHILNDFVSQKIEYELADQWLAVMPPDADRLAEVEGAIRATQGDARGAWCESVAAYRGRLVAYRDTQGKRPVVNVFLDLDNVTGGENDVLFDLNHATVTWILTDEAGHVIEPNAPVGKRAKEPMSQKVLVKSQCSVRLPLSQTDDDIPDSQNGFLTVAPGLAWVFNGGDEKACFLSCKIEMPFISRSAWYGTMELPKIALPIN